MKRKRTFEEDKEKLRELFEELLVALREKDRVAQDRIVQEENSIKKRLERKFGKFAPYRNAPIHKSHKMSRWRKQILAPAQTTPRLYTVRHCMFCNAEEAHHLVAHFVENKLYRPCKGAE